MLFYVMLSSSIFIKIKWVKETETVQKTIKKICKYLTFLNESIDINNCTIQNSLGSFSQCFSLVCLLFF